MQDPSLILTIVHWRQARRNSRKVETLAAMFDSFPALVMPVERKWHSHRLGKRVALLAMPVQWKWNLHELGKPVVGRAVPVEWK